VNEEPRQQRGPGDDAPPGPPAEEAVPAWELAARLESTQDRLLRAMADLENQRRRSGLEIARARAEAADEVLRSLMDVADAAGRGLAAVADRPDDPAAAGLAALAQQIDAAMRRHGAERIGTVGEPFDPERHEAVGVAAAPGLPDGAVAAVAREGYAVGDRLLRPAEVVVARTPGDAG
jgi:molecular chaperone GrpE